MRSIILSVLFSILIFQLNAQHSAAIIIDDDADSGAIRHMVSADFNNNGFNGIITAQAGSIDRIAIYWNSGDANFAKEVIDHPIDDPVFINYGDFNSNGFKDILVVTESNSEVFIYENHNGIFEERRQLGSVQSLGKSIAVADFDVDGHLDFVVIGQHSIDFYRNDGDANFNMEHILTTDTGPNILECLTMVLSDVNGNGIPDVVTGETIGIVAYINNGNGHFTPHIISQVDHHVVRAIDAFDANGNQKPDLVFHSQSEMGIYINHSSGQNIEFEYHGELFSTTSNTISHFATGDFTQNGSNDLFFANLGSPYLIINESDMVFSERIDLHDDPDLFIWTPLAADITGDGMEELIWAAAGGTLAYHTFETVGLNDLKSSPHFYPNPTTGHIRISTGNTVPASITVYSLSGRLILTTEETLPANLHLSELTSGTYFLKVETPEGSFSRKLIKH